MPRSVIHLSDLEPLDALRLRPSGAYEGTVTVPGPFVSDGRMLFAREAVPEAQRDLAERVAAQCPSAPPDVSQEEAGALLEETARRATRRVRVLGQLRRPGWVPAPTERVAVLRSGRGRSIRYFFVDAYRLLLLRTLVGGDEIFGGPGPEPVLVRRRGRPAGVLTALRIEPEVEP